MIRVPVLTQLTLTVTGDNPEKQIEYEPVRREITMRQCWYARREMSMSFLGRYTVVEDQSLKYKSFGATETYHDQIYTT